MTGEAIDRRRTAPRVRGYSPPSLLTCFQKSISPPSPDSWLLPLSLTTAGWWVGSPLEIPHPQNLRPGKPFMVSQVNSAKRPQVKAHTKGGVGEGPPPFLPSPEAGYRAPRLRVRGARLYWLRHVASVWLSAAPGICLLCLLSVCLQEPVSLFQLLCSLPALPLLGPILCGRS